MKHAELIERLEALTGPDREVDAEIAVLTRWRPLGIRHWVDDHPAGMSASRRLPGWVDLNEPPVPDTRWEAPHLTASIDAAVALVERCLPGWCGGVDIGDTDPMSDGVYGARVFNKNGSWLMFSGEGSTPAIALLIATLKALEATTNG